MQKYQKIKKLGSGSFGNVELAENKQTKQIVAIKQLKKKYGTWEECLQLSQVKALRKMSHQNVIKLKELIRIGNDAHLVFEYIQKDLFKLITQKKQKGRILEDYQIRYITKQIVEALAYIHRQGFFHRDLKPENVLIDNDFNIKIIDFGIAKQIRSKPPFTEYVSTRWYRAPEILFKFSAYSAPVDVFALGCIISQMYMMKPLFQGNSEMDQVSKITSVLGTPKVWPQGLKQAGKRGINLPQYSPIPLESIITNCPPDGIDFINQCLKWQPSKRITASQMLEHPYLQNIEFKLSFTSQNKNSLLSKKQIVEPQNKYLKNSSGQPSSSKNKNVYKDFENDQLFEQLLNNFENCNLRQKISEKKGIAKISKNDQDNEDQW